MMKWLVSYVTRKPSLSIGERMNRIALILLPLTISLLSCAEKDERLEGQEPGDCSDLADNDMDGDFDCDDDGCVNSPECDLSSNDTGAEPEEDTEDTDTQDTDTNDTDTDDTDSNDTDTDDTDDTDDDQFNQDSDGDGLTNGEELFDHGTEPTNPDTDGDGLSDGEEVNTYGTDPLNSDTDGDGLTDGEEVNTHGTNPTESDSDGDGYSDADEINEFLTDPLDASSGGYIGGWPVQPNRDTYNGPTDPSQTSANMGALLLRDQLMDQNGQMVDLYDFAGHGKHVVVVISAMWSGPDHQFADVILYDNNPNYGTLPQKVANEEVYLITIIGQNNTGLTPSLTDLQDWYSDHPNPLVPVLADTVNSDFSILYSNGFPTVVVFDENMQYVSGPTANDHWTPLSYIDGL